MLPTEPKALHILVADLILGFNSQLETTANMFVLFFFFFFFFEHPFQFQNQQKQTEEVGEGGRELGIEAGKQSSPRAASGLLFLEAGDEQIPPQSTRFSLLQLEKSKPLHFESSQSAQAHPHVPSCARHPWASSRDSAGSDHLQELQAPGARQ